MKPTMQSKPCRQRGVVAVEFALLILVFLSFTFGLIELARTMYLMNTVHEVTRRAAAAAATSDFSDGDRQAAIRRAAVFRNSGGELPLGAPVTDAHIRIDYLALVRDSTGNLRMMDISDGDLPESPGRNRQICLNNPNAPNCIRLVRARICVPAVTSTCNRVDYVTMFSLFKMPFRVPRATTIMPAESLGFRPGDAFDD